MPLAPGDVLPSGHRLVRRLPVPGGGWFLVHPGLRGRSWLASPTPRTRREAHPFEARVVERIPWPDARSGTADLFGLDGGRVLAETPAPWRVEDLRHFARDLRATLARAPGVRFPLVGPDEVVWSPRTRRVEVLPTLAEARPPIQDEGVAALLGALLPPGHPAALDALDALARGFGTPSELVEVLLGQVPVPGPLVRLAGFSLTGPRRMRNEDAIGWAARADRATVGIVADGIGGHTDGGTASRAAVRAVEAAWRASSGPLDQALAAAVHVAVAAVRREVARDAGVGTTLLVAAVGASLPQRSDVGYRVRIAHVGDGRAWRLGSGLPRLLTEDHTLVAAQVAAGRLTPEQARAHPHGNILLRSLGGEGSDAPVVDFIDTELAWGEGLLLATDGVWRALDDRVGSVAGHSSDPERAARTLLSELLENSEAENQTALFMGRV